MTSRDKHQEYIEMIVRNNRKNYEFMAVNLLYQDPYSPLCGEIDILAKRGNVLDLFEVKCNDRYFKKAISQLKRERDVIAAPGLETRLYYFCGSKDLLRRIR